MRVVPFPLRPGAGGESWEHAVGRLLLANLDNLYSAAYRMVGRADVAEDLVQETARRALAASALKDASHIRDWLFTILMNAARDYLRRRHRWEEKPYDEMNETALYNLDPQDVALAAAQDVRRALAQLAPRFRAVVILVDLEEFTISETAQMLNLPPGTVASRLARARQALRDLLRTYRSQAARERGRP